MRNFLPLILPFVMLGCSYQSMGEVLISSKFSPEQIEDVESAAREWCEVAEVCVSVTVTDDDAANVKPAADCSSGIGLTDLYENQGPVISMCGSEVTPFRVIILHEFGHAFFPESEHHDGVGVMRAQWDAKSHHLTEEDLQLVMSGR